MCCRWQANEERSHFRTRIERTLFAFCFPPPHKGPAPDLLKCENDEAMAVVVVLGSLTQPRPREESCIDWSMRDKLTEPVKYLVPSLLVALWYATIGIGYARVLDALESLISHRRNHRND